MPWRRSNQRVDASACGNMASIDPGSVWREPPSRRRRTGAARAVRLRRVRRSCRRSTRSRTRGSSGRVRRRIAWRIPVPRPAAASGGPKTCSSTFRTRSTNARVIRPLREQPSIDVERRVEVALLEIQLGHRLGDEDLSGHWRSWHAHRRRRLRGSEPRRSSNSTEGTASSAAAAGSIAQPVPQPQSRLVRARQPKRLARSRLLPTVPPRHEGCRRTAPSRDSSRRSRCALE